MTRRSSVLVSCLLTAAAYAGQAEAYAAEKVLAGQDGWNPGPAAAGVKQGASGASGKADLAAMQ